jgi:hypothetical protein
MESAEPESPQHIRSATKDVVVEWTATIRGRPVSVSWHGGKMAGDDEVLERISRLPGEQVRLDSLDGTREAVTRVLLDPVELIRLLPGPVPPSPESPTPNEPLPPPPGVAS